MASAANVQLGRELAGIVGPEFVCEESAPLTAFAVDGVRPGVMVSPGSVDEVAAVIQLANQVRVSVAVAGGFTKQGMGTLPESVDILLKTERLHDVMHFDPGDLTIGAQAGCKVASIQTKVAEHGLVLPLDIPRAGLATIGGALATSSFGPMKHFYGGVREYCIGVSFVTGGGRIAKAGGRVVKNVAGYDLMKLMIGSHGTLGVITSANFKLFPAPKQTATFMAEFESCERAVEFRDVVRRSPLTPLCLEVVSPRAHAYVDSGKESWAVAVRASGSDAVIGRYRRELGATVSRELNGEAEGRFWLGVQEFPETISKQHQNVMLVRMHVAPANVTVAIREAERSALDNNLLFAAVGRMGVASLIGAFVPLAVDPPAAMQYANAIESLRAKLPRGAVVNVERCPREAKTYFSVWGESANDIEAMKAVKGALDPNGIMNRGRFLF